MGLAGRLSLAWLALLAGLGAAWAEAPLQGSFRASRACEAMLSIRKNTNPGRVITGPGISYQLLAGNRKKPTHFRILVPGADPPERWVAAECGDLQPSPPPVLDETQTKPVQAGGHKERDYVLALSWQPAFCESNAQKRECRWQNTWRYDANHLSLHGLWPQPQSLSYCDLPDAVRQAGEGGRWRDLPPVALSLSAQADLEQLMPGAQSLLERHEWAKHGSCYPADAETYFRDSFRLLREVNASAVADLFARGIGRRLTAADIRAAFDQAFGTGAGNRVRITCKDAGDRRLITEITLGLRGDIPSGTKLSQLMLAADKVDPGCPAGIVDPVGTQ